MSSILVDYKDGKVIVKDKNEIVKETKNFVLYGRDAFDEKEFIREQHTFNYLDVIKDATVTGGGKINIVQLLDNMPDGTGKLAFFPKKDSNKIKGADNTPLENLEKKIFEKTEGNARAETYTKIKKGNDYVYGGITKHVINKAFYDAGSDPKRYFKNETYNSVETFGTFIDPATKAGTPEYFPQPGKKIELTTRFMNLFGFDECSIKATLMNNGNYSYDIRYHDVTIFFDGNGKDPNEKYYKGNATKNDFLKNNGDNHKTSEEKIKLILMKELGDKLQVLIAYVWTFLNYDSHAVCTNDKVVATLCRIIGIRSFLVYEGQIHHFEPTSDPKKKLIEDFFTSCKNNLNTNSNSIRAIEDILNIPNAPIKIDGVNETYVFKKEFYINIIKDLQDIQKECKNVYDACLSVNLGSDKITASKEKTFMESIIQKTEKLPKTKSTENILLAIKTKKAKADLKDFLDTFEKYFEKQFVIRSLIRKTKTGVTLLAPTGYTFGLNAKPHLTEYLLEQGIAANLQQLSILKIATNYKPFVDHKFGGFSGGDVDGSNSFNSEDINATAFDDTPVEYPDPEDPEKTINLIQVLEDKIHSILQGLHMDHYFYSVYSDLLFEFYIDRKVADDDELRQKIKRIVADINEPVASLKAAPTVKNPVAVKSISAKKRKFESVHSRSHSRSFSISNSSSSRRKHAKSVKHHHNIISKHNSTLKRPRYTVNSQRPNNNLFSGFKVFQNAL